jgi:two-component system cell cycle response regulator
MLAAVRDISERLSQEAEYYRLATHDSLTGLLNRASMWDILNRDVTRARRGGRELALLLVDVDRFKLVNDTLGHLAGDEVLRAVAGRIAATMRAGDASCRFGGEEFVVILPETDAEEAMVAAERLRAAITGTPVTTRAGTVTCTASIGVATLPPGVAEDGEALVHAADMAMLEAKRTGRNRVCRRLLIPA